VEDGRSRSAAAIAVAISTRIAISARIAISTRFAISTRIVISTAVVELLLLIQLDDQSRRADLLILTCLGRRRAQPKQHNGSDETDIRKFHGWTSIALNE